MEPSKTFVFIGRSSGAGASTTAATKLHLLPPHPVDPGGELDGVERLRVVAGLGGDVGQEGGLAADRAENFSQQPRHSALLEGKMSLAVEDAEDDVAEAGLGDAAPDRLGPLAPTEVNEMEPGPAAQQDGGAGVVVDAVLVQVECEDQVRVSALGVHRSVGEGTVQVVAGLLGTAGSDLGQVLDAQSSQSHPQPCSGNLIKPILDFTTLFRHSLFKLHVVQEHF